MYDKAVVEEILWRLSQGETLRGICKSEGMPAPSTVCLWEHSPPPHSPDFPERYARARNDGLEMRAEEIIEIADTCTDPQKARVQIDARKWLLSKMRPDKYGDRTVLAGDEKAPLNVTVTYVGDKITK